jgi:DNA-binding transcriptional MerR regulator
MTPDVENLLTIGRFAAEARLSRKALRLYADRGLLEPAWTDPASGYRYYDLRQLERASLISLLRRGGMPLAQIGAFLAQPSVEQLDAFERAATAAFVDRRRVLRYIRRILEEVPLFDIDTKHVDAVRYASRTANVKIDGLDEFIRTTVDGLAAGADPDARPFSIFHGAVTEDDDGPVEVCVPRSNGDRELPAGEVVFTRIEGEETEFPFVLGAYRALYRWATEAGRTLAGPPREIYLFDPGELPRMEVAFPLG